MRVTAEKDETGTPEVVLRDVFSGVKFVTEEGNCLGVCMRDAGYEISVFSESEQATSAMKNPVWFNVDSYKQTIQCMTPPSEKPESTAGFNIVGLHCLAPRKLQLVQEHALAQPQYVFMLSEQEHTLLQKQYGYFLVEMDEHETRRDELFAYTLDQGRSFITTESMHEVLHEFEAAEARRNRSLHTVYAGKHLKMTPDNV